MAVEAPLTNGHSAHSLSVDSPSTNGHATNGLSEHTPLNNGHATQKAQTNGHVNGNGTNSKPTPQYNQRQAPIAICGMACRLPGGLASPEELWEFLLNKKDGRCRVPESRYSIDTYYSDTKKPGTVPTQYGYFLDESVELGALDMSFFSMARSEVERADPQQRIMLEVAREAFEDAGITDWRGQTIGTYIGNFGEDWLEMMGKETQPHGIHRISGAGDFVVANRLSYEFDLQGPR